MTNVDAPADAPDADVPPAEFTHAGRVVRLGPSTDATRTRYERALLDAEERDARATFEAGRITRDELLARLLRLEGQAARREHAPGGALWRDYCPGLSESVDKAAAGLVLYVWSVAVDRVPGLTPADVRAGIENDPAAVRAVVRRMFPELLDQLADHLVDAGTMPAAERAALVALGDQSLAAYAHRPAPAA